MSQFEANLPRILIATNNPHKVEEIGAMLEQSGMPVKVLSLLDYPHLDVPEESGDTLQENAIAKANFAAKHTGLVSIADDSGLEVDALGGEPGVHSKRFAGESATDAERYGKLLEMMKNIPAEKRQARFRCCIAIAVPGQQPVLVEGIVNGKITFSPVGEHGFGYDPVFVPEKMGITMAQLPLEEKNRISHRSRALHAAIPVIKRILSEAE